MRRLAAKLMRARALRPRQADIGQPPFLLQPLGAFLVHRALRGEQPFLPAGQEHGVEFQPLGRVQRHQVDAVAGVAVLFQLHHQAETCSRNAASDSYCSIERTSSFRLSSRPGASGRFVALQHVGVAAFVQHDLGQFGMRQICFDCSLQRATILAQVAQRLARLGRQFFGLGDFARRRQQRHAGFARANAAAPGMLASPMPRLGLLTMRSKARSSSPCAISRK